MRLKQCLHPDDHLRQLRNEKNDAAWCSLCGALLQSGHWRLPGTMLEPKRFIVLTPEELPPHSDRRAWETFAASMHPTAIAIVAGEFPDMRPEEKEVESAKLAGILADRMMSEWAQRFAPKEGE